LRVEKIDLVVDVVALSKAAAALKTSGGLLKNSQSSNPGPLQGYVMLQPREQHPAPLFAH
jgi:hypothetical protein